MMQHLQPQPSGTNTIRTLNQPQALMVEADDQSRPRVIVRHRQRQRVTAIQDVWRIDDEWWREPISRRYFQIILETDEIRTIYQDLLNGEWFEQWY
jgi:hypothetical protein